MPRGSRALRFGYSLLACLAAPGAFAVVLWRGVRDPSYRQGLRERFGFGPTAVPPTVWVHAVSLGEMTAAAPLVSALRRIHPRFNVVMTTATPTGRARAAALLGAHAGVRFLPYDTPGSVARFLRRIRPRLGIIMETELWPNLYAACGRRGIPLLLANARLSARSVRRYRRFHGLLHGVFAATRHIAAQSAADADRFVAIGADPQRISVIGNLKFDLAPGAGAAAAGRALRDALCGARPTWIAGSTHPGEEETLLRAHAALQAAIPDALLLLVPRHPARFQSVADLLGRTGVRFERRSDGNAPRNDAAVLLIDSVGELGTLYAAADVAFVGGSLVPVGGHNLLEAAALGIPILTGPHQENAPDVARRLIEAGAAVAVADGGELAAQLRELMADPVRRAHMGESGLRLVESNRGSVQRLMDLVTALLPES